MRLIVWALPVCSAGCSEGSALTDCPPASEVSLSLDQPSAIAGSSAVDWFAGFAGQRPATLLEVATGAEEPVALTVTVTDPGRAVDVTTDGLPDSAGRRSVCGSGDHLRLEGVAVRFEVTPDSGDTAAIAELGGLTLQVYGPEPKDGVAFGPSSSQPLPAPPSWLEAAVSSRLPGSCDGPTQVHAGFGVGATGAPWDFNFWGSGAGCSWTALEVRVE